jgi:hypothetical protein
MVLGFICTIGIIILSITDVSETNQLTVANYLGKILKIEKIKKNETFLEFGFLIKLVINYTFLISLIFQSRI